jgi:hypothetical protein
MNLKEFKHAIDRATSCVQDEEEIEVFFSGPGENLELVEIIVEGSMSVEKGNLTSGLSDQSVTFGFKCV